MAWGIRDYAGPSKIFWSSWYFHLFMSTQNLGESCKYFMGFIHFYLKNYFNKIWKSFLSLFFWPILYINNFKFQIHYWSRRQREERRHGQDYGSFQEDSAVGILCWKHRNDYLSVEKYLMLQFVWWIIYLDKFWIILLMLERNRNKKKCVLYL